MINTIKKDKAFCLTADCQESFELLKERLTIAPILAHFEFEKKCIMEINILDNVSVGVLSQYSDNRLLYFIAFFSYKRSPQEINYEIYDKKLLVIIRSFKK